MSLIKKITVQSIEISISQSAAGSGDYISLTDMSMAKNDAAKSGAIIQNWLRSRDTIEFLGAWEQLSNPNFNVLEFEYIRNESGVNRFTLSAKQWIERTNAIGIISKSGRYGGTYAHTDIAFEFGTWISPVFKLYVIKEYQRLKEAERHPMLGEWNVKRILSKVNYNIHTDAIKNFIIPTIDIEKQKLFIYADEADLLNLALWRCTAKQWRDANPDSSAKGLNIRDLASINELVVLSNMEAFNAELIKRDIPKPERYRHLQKMAAEQLAHLNAIDAEKTFRNASLQTKKLID